MGCVETAHRISRSSLAWDWQMNEQACMDETMCLVGSLIDESQNDKSKRKQAYTFEFKIQIIKEVEEG